MKETNTIEKQVVAYNNLSPINNNNIGALDFFSLINRAKPLYTMANDETGSQARVAELPDYRGKGKEVVVKYEIYNIETYLREDQEKRKKFQLIELNQTQQKEDERFGYLAWGTQENGTDQHHKCLENAKSRITKVTFQYSMVKEDVSSSQSFTTDNGKVSIPHVTDEFKIKVNMVDELTNRANLCDFTTRCRFYKIAGERPQLPDVDSLRKCEDKVEEEKVKSQALLKYPALFLTKKSGELRLHETEQMILVKILGSTAKEDLDHFFVIYDSVNYYIERVLLQNRNDKTFHPIYYYGIHQMTTIASCQIRVKREVLYDLTKWQDLMKMMEKPNNYLRCSFSNKGKSRIGIKQQIWSPEISNGYIKACKICNIHKDDIDKEYDIVIRIPNIENGFLKETRRTFCILVRCNELSNLIHLIGFRTYMDFVNNLGYQSYSRDLTKRYIDNIDKSLTDNYQRESKQECLNSDIIDDKPFYVKVLENSQNFENSQFIANRPNNEYKLAIA
ncbi:hypothetical protein H8356DRAFT_1351427 [Neocallimastix lanati (nom. inval.)]|nr:hypothetical protein H8356DRAFT_1351427 [Neocallimastix sp. JGI-2020a]